MKTPVRSIALAAGFCLTTGMVWAGGPKAKGPAEARAFLRELLDPTPLAPDVLARVHRLIVDLGNGKWRIRNGAFGELLKIGPKAEPMVTEALQSADPERRIRAELLLEAYRLSQKDRPAGLTGAVDLLAAAEEKSVLDALIRLLTHRDGELRYAAEYGLRRLTGRQFGYSAYSPEAAQNAAARRWAAWWEQSRRTFRFQTSPPAIAGVLTWNASGQEVFLVSLTGEVLWSRKLAQRPFSVDVVPNGGLLVLSYENGQPVLTEQTRDGKVVWSAALDFRGPLHSMHRLPNGNTLATDRMGGRIVEIGPKGKGIVWQYAYPPPRCPSASAQRLANGNTLICLHYRTVFEVNRAGKIVWTHDDTVRPRDARKLANGNVLISEQGRKRVFEVRQDGKEVWTWTHPDSYPLSACRLGDGRTVIQTRQKGLLLVDRSGKVIRTLSDHRPDSFAKVRLVPATYYSATTASKKPG